MTAYIKSDNHIHIVFESGESTTVYNSQPEYTPLCDAIKRSDWETAYDAAFPVEIVKKQINSYGTDITQHVSIHHGIIMFDGIPVHGTLTTRMLKMIDEQFDVRPMGLFLENLMENPSYRAVNELYEFLEKSQLPITEDGHFLAYKKVRNNFKDIHSGTFDNSPGTRIQMERNTVNEDKNQTCSTGLHFCAYSYLNHYGNSSDNKILMIKINPKDVVSIPTDYDDAKGRCCEYVVVSEITLDAKTYLPSEKARIDNAPIIRTYSPGAVHQKRNDVILCTHDSAKEAALSTGLRTADIRRVCNGNRKSTGGFNWEWVKHEETKLPIDLDDEYDYEMEDTYEDDHADD